MNDALLAQAKRLPISERLELIAALWDTLDGNELPVTCEEREVLEARMADIEANPSAEESWSEAKTWLESRPR
jgi:putative addiction module component (TIGR02574 family)